MNSISLAAGRQRFHEREQNQKTEAAFASNVSMFILINVRKREAHMLVV